jgi:dTDP-4-dehydrorhamnose 3,5-epimerase
MKTMITTTPLAGVVLVNINYFQDERGFFIEPWNKRDFAEAGLDLEFVQEGHSRSGFGVLRGLHYQDMTAPMGKLVRCTLGKLFDVVVDLRISSPTFGKWFGVELSTENKTQIYVPPGFAHGFVSLADAVEIQYKQTGFYTPSSEGTLAWNDPDVAVDWPIKNPVLSKRDQSGKLLKDYIKNPAF